MLESQGSPVFILQNDGKTCLVLGTMAPSYRFRAGHPHPWPSRTCKHLYSTKATAAAVYSAPKGSDPDRARSRWFLDGGECRPGSAAPGPTWAASPEEEGRGGSVQLGLGARGQSQPPSSSPRWYLGVPGGLRAPRAAQTQVAAPAYPRATPRSPSQANRARTREAPALSDAPVHAHAGASPSYSHSGPPREVTPT